MMKKENSFDNLLVQSLQEIAKDKEPHLIYEGVQQKLQQERKRAMKTTSKNESVSQLSVASYYLG